MTFGERVAYQRKQKNWSQSELAAKAETSARVLSRYENDLIKPSIEAAARIAEALGVTVDYLISGSAASFDKENTIRMQQIQELAAEDQQHILTTLDALIRDAKARSAYK
jgi:transcriptional regulator with XRE-family HTH domain